MKEGTDRHTKEEIKEKVDQEIKWYGQGYAAFFIALGIGIVIAALSLNGFLSWTEDLQNQQLVNFDKKVTDYIYSYRSEAMTDWVIVITDMGDEITYGVLIIAVAIWFLIDKKNIRWLIQSVVILASTSLLNVIIKHYISRERPTIDMRLVEAHSYSYPSGHSMCALAFYGFLIYLAYYKVKHTWVKLIAFIFLPLLIIAIGASRVYLGVHFPSDVVAGFAAGLFWLVFVIFVINAFKTYRRRKKQKEAQIALEDTEED